MTFDQAMTALDAGKLEMMRPWGDWVRVRRRPSERLGPASNGTRWRMVDVWMEAEVVSLISEASDRFGQPYLRVAA